MHKNQSIFERFKSSFLGRFNNTSRAQSTESEPSSSRPIITVPLSESQKSGSSSQPGGTLPASTRSSQDLTQDVDELFFERQMKETILASTLIKSDVRQPEHIDSPHITSIEIIDNSKSSDAAGSTSRAPLLRQWGNSCTPVSLIAITEIIKRPVESSGKLMPSTLQSAVERAHRVGREIYQKKVGDGLFEAEVYQNLPQRIISPQAQAIHRTDVKLRYQLNFQKMWDAISILKQEQDQTSLEKKLERFFARFQKEIIALDLMGVDFLEVDEITFVEKYSSIDDKINSEDHNNTLEETLVLLEDNHAFSMIVDVETGAHTIAIIRKNGIYYWYDPRLGYVYHTNNISEGAFNALVEQLYLQYGDKTGPIVEICRWTLDDAGHLIFVPGPAELSEQLLISSSTELPPISQKSSAPPPPSSSAQSTQPSSGASVSRSESRASSSRSNDQAPSVHSEAVITTNEIIARYQKLDSAFKSHRSKPQATLTSTSDANSSSSGSQNKPSNAATPRQEGDISKAIKLAEYIAVIDYYYDSLIKNKDVQLTPAAIEQIFNVRQAANSIHNLPEGVKQQLRDTYQKDNVLSQLEEMKHAQAKSVDYHKQQLMQSFSQLYSMVEASILEVVADYVALIDVLPQIAIPTPEMLANLSEKRQRVAEVLAQIEQTLRNTPETEVNKSYLDGLRELCNGLSASLIVEQTWFLDKQDESRLGSSATEAMSTDSLLADVTRKRGKSQRPGLVSLADVLADQLAVIKAILAKQTVSYTTPGEMSEATEVDGPKPQRARPESWIKYLGMPALSEPAGVLRSGQPKTASQDGIELSSLPFDSGQVQTPRAITPSLESIISSRSPETKQLGQMDDGLEARHTDDGSSIPEIVTPMAPVPKVMESKPAIRNTVSSSFPPVSIRTTPSYAPEIELPGTSGGEQTRTVKSNVGGSSLEIPTLKGPGLPPSSEPRPSSRKISTAKLPLTPVVTPTGSGPSDPDRPLPPPPPGVPSSSTPTLPSTTDISVPIPPTVTVTAPSGPLDAGSLPDVAIEDFHGFRKKEAEKPEAKGGGDSYSQFTVHDNEIHYQYSDGINQGLLQDMVGKGKWPQDTLQQLASQPYNSRKRPMPPRDEVVKTHVEHKTITCTLEAAKANEVPTLSRSKVAFALIINQTEQARKGYTTPGIRSAAVIEANNYTDEASKTQALAENFQLAVEMNILPIIAKDDFEKVKAYFLEQDRTKATTKAPEILARLEILIENAALLDVNDPLKKFIDLQISKQYSGVSLASNGLLSTASRAAAPLVRLNESYGLGCDFSAKAPLISKSAKKDADLDDILTQSSRSNAFGA